MIKDVKICVHLREINLIIIIIIIILLLLLSRVTGTLENVMFARLAYMPYETNLKYLSY